MSYRCGNAVKLNFGLLMVVLKTKDIFMKVNPILQFLLQFLCVPATWQSWDLLFAEPARKGSLGSLGSLGGSP